MLMGRRSRGGAGVATSRIFAPGIVTNGEAMRITRKGFIVPDETPRPLGKRSMVVGRRTYTWHTSADTSPLNGQRVTDTLPDDDDGSAPMPVQVTHAGGFVRTGYVTSPDGGKSWEVQRTTDMGDAPLPKLAASADLRPPKQPRAPRVKSAQTQAAPDPGMTRDEIVRAYLASKGLGHVLELTPAIRAAALDAIAAERQMADYVGA